jgi:tight adherence protein B
MSLLVASAAALGALLTYSGLTLPARRERPAVMSTLDRLTDEAGMTRISGSGLVVVTVAVWAVSLVVVAGLTRSIVVAFALSLAAASLPFSMARARRRQRRRRFREAWPDAIATLIAGVRAGISLPESCAALVERGPSELREGFRSFTAAYRSSGSFATALERLRTDLADPIADRVIAALSLAHEVGGTDLVRVLRTLGDFVREDIRVRKEIEARWSWTVTAARLAAAAPWIVLLMMSTRPEAAVAYNSTAGAAVVAGGAAATAIGYRLMLRAARLPEDNRLDLEDRRRPW